MSLTIQACSLQSYLCTCNNVLAVKQRAVVPCGVFLDSFVCLSVLGMGWELGLCVADTAALLSATLHPELASQNGLRKSQRCGICYEDMAHESRPEVQ